MSDEFLKVARKEIQYEIESLDKIFLSCTNDEQFHIKSEEIEKHIHKIKGLAPMMGQEGIGEIARISDLVLKFVIIHGLLKGSHKIIFEAIQRMSYLFNQDIKNEPNNFRKQVKDTFPQISGL